LELQTIHYSIANQIKIMTSLQISNKTLAKLKADREIDPQDIVSAQTLLGISQSTVYLYLSGEGTSPNTAYDLAHFFTKRRDARLNGTKKITLKNK
jgi:hypothetical protein